MNRENMASIPVILWRFIWVIPMFVLGGLLVVCVTCGWGFRMGGRMARDIFG